MVESSSYKKAARKDAPNRDEVVKISRFRKVSGNIRLNGYFYYIYLYVLLPKM